MRQILAKQGFRGGMRVSRGPGSDKDIRWKSFLFSASILPVYFRMPFLKRYSLGVRANCVSRGTISIGLLSDMFHVEQARQLPILVAQSPMPEQSKPG
jgi:hypothetical protein